MKPVIKSPLGRFKVIQKMSTFGEISALTWYCIWNCAFLTVSHLILLSFCRMFKCPWNFPHDSFTPESSMLTTKRLFVAEGKAERENVIRERRKSTCHPMFSVTFLSGNDIYIVSCLIPTKSAPTDMKETSFQSRMCLDMWSAKCLWTWIFRQS